MKKLFAVLIIAAVMAGCESTPPLIATTQAPTYGYKPLVDTLNATRPEGQAIKLVYGGQRYKQSDADIEVLRYAIGARIEGERIAKAEQSWREADLAALYGGGNALDQIQARWKYESAMSDARDALDALDGQPVPLVAISSDPAKPCTIELPPPRNTGDADFFRALGEATYACMAGKWR